MKQTLILIRGLPGSGKTTFAKSICNLVVSADDFFTDDEGNYNFDVTKLSLAHDWCYSQVAFHLSYGHSVAVANTFTQEWEMQRYFDLAEEYRIPVFSVIVENRHGNESIHDVPKETIEKMRKRFTVKL
jgi:predicted kinase